MYNFSNNFPIERGGSRKKKNVKVRIVYHLKKIHCYNVDPIVFFAELFFNFHSLVSYLTNFPRPLTDHMKQTTNECKHSPSRDFTATELVPQNLHKVLEKLDQKAGLNMEMR